MVCICGNSKCSCSKNCSCTTAICFCVPCMNIRFNLEVSPSREIQALTNSHQPFPQYDKSIIPGTKRAEINGNNNLTIPSKGNRGQSPDDEKFDNRFAQMIQKIILKQGLRSPVSTSSAMSKFGSEDLRRIAECATYSSVFEKRANEKLANSLRKETSKIEKRSKFQKGSKHFQTASNSSVKRSKLQSSDSEDGYQNSLQINNDLDFPIERSSPTSSRINEDSTEKFVIRETTQLPAVFYLPSTSQFRPTFHLSDSKPTHTIAFPSYQNISSSNCIDQMQNVGDTPYTPLGALEDIFGQDTNLERMCTSNRTRDPNIQFPIKKMNEPSNLKENKKVEELQYTALEGFQDLSSGAFNEIIGNIKNENTKETQFNSKERIEKNTLFSQLLEYAASLRLDIETSEMGKTN